MSKVRSTVEKSNRKYKTMTDAEKRVAVAKDALLALGKRQYLAMPGTYIGLDDETHIKVARANQSTAQKLLLKMPHCEVCAVGAAAISCVRKFDACLSGSFPLARLG